MYFYVFRNRLLLNKYKHDFDILNYFIENKKIVLFVRSHYRRSTHDKN